MGLRNPFRRRHARVATPAPRYPARDALRVHDVDNTGSVSINSQGHLAVGVGAGLAVDASDGSIGVQMGGFTVDTPSSEPANCSYTPSPSYFDSSPSYDSGSSYSSSSYDSGSSSSYSSSDSGSSFSSCD